VTNSIPDAIAQVNAGADAVNTIILRSTEGPHLQPGSSTWAIGAGKSVNFVAESGQPVVVLQHTAGKFMLTVGAGTNANLQTETLTFTGIAFIPQAGLNYANNTADGFGLIAGNFVFANCVFSSNNGSNGVVSQNGEVPYANSNNFGDDLIEITTRNNVTFSNCTITGAYDDAILIAGAQAPEISTLRLDKGTCVTNNGGAGIQVYGSNTALVLDGELGRVQIAHNGKRPSSNDTGIKFFWDATVTLVMNKADVLGHNNGGVVDFEGIDSMTITESRIAFNNTLGLANVGNLSVWDTAAANAGDSPNTVQAILLDNVTVHDANQVSIFGAEGPTQPAQAYTIIDSIFSGAGDTFDQMTNSTNQVAPSPAPVVTFSAAVTAGDHAIANVGELAGATVNADPGYVSVTYTVGRNQENPDFLRPTAPAYATANSTGGLLRGGAPDPGSGVEDFMLY
jgi:hypothetical protein